MTCQAYSNTTAPGATNWYKGCLQTTPEARAVCGGLLTAPCTSTDTARGWSTTMNAMNGRGKGRGLGELGNGENAVGKLVGLGTFRRG